VERFELLNWFGLCFSIVGDTEKLKRIKDRLRDTVERISGGSSLQVLLLHYPVVSALHGCSPSLKHLSLEGTCASKVDQLSSFSGPKARLESLEVSCTVGEWYEGAIPLGLYQYLLHPSGRFDLSALLHLSWVENTLNHLAEIMGASKRGITSLELEIGQLPLSSVSPVDVLC
jgi:hypothetical protein